MSNVVPFKTRGSWTVSFNRSTDYVATVQAVSQEDAESIVLRALAEQDMERMQSFLTTKAATNTKILSIKAK